jgi:hypothetical protein
MSNEWKPVRRIAWTFVLVSSVLLAMSLWLLAMSFLAFERRFDLFEAMGCSLAALSLAGLISGVGLLKRSQLARYSALSLLVLAAAYWGLSIINLLFALAGEPTKFLAELGDYPFSGAGVCLISLLGLAWCIYCFMTLRRAEVRREFGT